MRKLSERSKKALELLKEGKLTTKEIALTVGLSYYTVASLKNKFKIKGVSKRVIKKRYGTILLLKCKKCKRTFEIRVNNLKVYTDELKKNWICLSCKNNANK